MSDEIAMAWLQLTLAAGQHHPEQLEDALLQAGALAVILQDAGDQPVLEPLPGEMPLWTQTQVTGLFEAQTDIEVVKQTLRHALASDTLPTCRLESLADRDWEKTWLDDFHPMQFGKRLWVCPRDQTPPQPAAINLALDPGLAFGTGTHPTTALCLEWLDAAELHGQSVIDYGCGSGILAIAAAKLGATQVWAVDIDDQALLAGEQNAIYNKVANLVRLSKPETLPKNLQVDILVANILAGPLIGLATQFSQRIKPGGRLVLSGILNEQADAVEAAFRSWFNFDLREQRDEWTLLQATRQR